MKVLVGIKSGDQEFEPGLTCEVLGSTKKMVGKSYNVKFEDGREAELHVVFLNVQMEVIQVV